MNCKKQMHLFVNDVVLMLVLDSDEVKIQFKKKTLEITYYAYKKHSPLRCLSFYC